MVAKLLKWMWRAWPLWIALALLLRHVMLLRVLPDMSTRINSTLFLTLQLVGGAIVLYSIDANIGVVRKGSLLAEFFSYLSEFPLLRRSLVINLKGQSTSVVGGTMRGRITRTPQSTEEGLKYLQEQIDEIRRDHDEELKALKKSLSDRIAKIESSVSNLSTNIRELDEKLDSTIVGDIRVQLFGVILIAYGAIGAYAA